MQGFLRSLILLYIATSGYAFSPDRIVIQSGHTGPVTRLAVTEKERTLVSISDDGTLRVWDTATRELTHRVQISPLPLVGLAVHPALPRAAVIESDGISVYRLSVWDWSENRRIFSRDLRARPLYLSFSPGGAFLAYSVADWQSMTILDSDTGSRPPYLERGFGIVSAFRISSSEQRILAYLPSGSIQYRDLRSGALVQEYGTLSDLQQLSFVANNRYMIGIWEDTLIAVDLLSGSDIASIRVRNLESYAVDEETGTLHCVIAPQAEDDARSIQAMTFTANGFRPRVSRYGLPQGFSSNHLEAGRVLYAGTESGEIYYQPTLSNAPRLFSRNRLLPVSDFDASDSLMLASPTSIMTLYADFLHQPTESLSAGVISHTQDNPLGAPVFIHSAGDGVYALQVAGDGQASYLLFSPVEGPVDPIMDFYEAPILSIDTRDEQILTVDSTGRIQLYDRESNSFLFETQLSGMTTAIFLDAPSILAAGRRSRTLQASKLLIDTSTDETVPFIDTSIETVLVAYDPMRRTLYTLSVEGTSANPTTVLTAHSGSIFQQEEILYSVPGRVTGESMSVHRGTLVLSTSGVNRALYSGTDRFMPVDGNANIPVKVEVTDHWIIGLNRDFSLSVWERATGKLVLNFYLFDDLSWVAVTRTGRTISSNDLPASHIKAYR